MKHLMPLTLFLFSTFAIAQEGVPFNQRIWCFDQRSVMEVLSRDYKETPMFHGESDNINYVLYTNDRTGGWTMIAYQDGLGCIMAAGKKHKLIFGSNI